jgi:SAM-dependent methyltransferase
MELWNYFTTNKGKKITKWKHYFPIYEKHFTPIRNKPIKILEIGILNGGSLEMWRYYFPEATIVGIDINPLCKEHEQEGINVRIGDQTDEKFLQSLIDEFGTFDLIIDDGSHHVAHVNKTFQFLFPKLADEGIYFIEDTHAAYWDSHGGSIKEPESINNVAKEMIDSINADHARGQKEPDYFTKNVKCMSVYDSIIVFDKGNVGEKIPMEIGISRIVMQPDSVPKINEGWVSFRTD